MSSRLKRERKTVKTMIAMYCDKHHGTGGLCPECKELIDYSSERLEKCPFQEEKPTCAKCPVHCYKPEMRENIRNVMRWSGPRMIYKHPVMGVLHIIDGRKNTSIKKPGKA